jgi:hypothetical protein
VKPAQVLPFELIRRYLGFSHKGGAFKNVVLRHSPELKGLFEPFGRSLAAAFVSL